MPFTIKPKINREYTPPITYLKGEYALHKFKIPYLSVVLPMDFIAQHFSLIDEIGNTESIEWTLEELFQRDISWERIDEELIQYLKNESTQQFFNALTVALLPKENHGLAKQYSVDVPAIPDMEGDLEDPIQIGSIQIQSYKGSDDLAGQIRWDPKDVAAIAVDGQHRLAAIKEVQGKLKMESLERTSVPIILLIPDERFGYTEPKTTGSEKSVITSLRKVFIDLNENARQVSRARNILLNDQDIVCMCTRSLVGTKLTKEKEEDRIPLAIVDWVSEKNKFETGPFLSTILILHDVVATAISIRSLKEPEEENDKSIRKWFEDYFSPSTEELDLLMQQVRKCYNQEVPLTFMPSEIKLLSQLFESKYRCFIFKIFSDLQPYKDLWNFTYKKGFWNPSVVTLYVEQEIKTGRKSDQRVEEIKDALKRNDQSWNYNKFTESLNYIDKEIKKDNWFFKVVFQKALFESFFKLKTQSTEFGCGSDNEFIDLWIKQINKLVDSGLHKIDSKVQGLSERFWTGISLNSENVIEYTKVGTIRITFWLNVWVLLGHIHDTHEEIESYDLMLESDDQIYHMVNASIVNNPVKAGMTKIIRAKQEGISEADLQKEIHKSLKKRYSGLVKLMS